MDLLRKIASSVRYRKRKNNIFVIEINPYVIMNNSTNPIDQVVRFLDRGDIGVKGTYQFSRIFDKYRYNMDRYWKSYCFSRLGRVKVNRVVMIN